MELSIRVRSRSRVYGGVRSNSTWKQESPAQFLHLPKRIEEKEDHTTVSALIKIRAGKRGGEVVLRRPLAIRHPGSDITRRRNRELSCHHQQASTHDFRDHDPTRIQKGYNLIAFSLAVSTPTYRVPVPNCSATKWRANPSSPSMRDPLRSSLPSIPTRKPPRSLLQLRSLVSPPRQQS